MDSLPPFLWGSFIPYNMPVYPGAFPDKSLVLIGIEAAHNVAGPADLLLPRQFR